MRRPAVEVGRPIAIANRKRRRKEKVKGGRAISRRDLALPPKHFYLRYPWPLRCPAGLVLPLPSYRGGLGGGADADALSLWHGGGCGDLQPV